MKEYNEKLLFDNLGKAENNKLAVFSSFKSFRNLFCKDENCLRYLPFAKFLDAFPSERKCTTSHRLNKLFLTFRLT